MSDTPLSLPELLARTPARAFVGRSGTAYRTATALKLREDHAAARDAVHAELDLLRDFGPEIERLGLFEARTRATSKAEYLRRPDLGRRLDPDSFAAIRANCPSGVDLQVAIGDGLSSTAAAVQGPGLLERIRSACLERGWSFGRPFLVKFCRVGVMNEIGEALAPSVMILLVGERPGLATAESLGAYLGFRPRPGHTDADRNLISNIHGRGVGLDEAAERIMRLAAAMRSSGTSGANLHEEPGHGRVDQRGQEADEERLHPEAGEIGAAARSERPDAPELNPH